MNSKDIDNQIRKNIGENIKKLRRNREITAEHLASKLGVQRTTITQIENGINNINAVTLWKIACLFGCKFEDFFPDISEDYILTKNNLDEIAKKDKNAIEWAQELFGSK